ETRVQTREVAMSRRWCGLCVGLLVSIPVGAWATPTIESHEEIAARDLDADLRIESRVDDGKWRRDRAVALRSEQSLTLRVDPDVDVTGAEVRWYLVFADITQEYQNANKPWEEDPGEWTGFDTIQYLRIE